MTTTITTQDIIDVGKRSSLSATMLAEWAPKGTPKQRQYLHAVLVAEYESRQETRRSRLLKAAKLPAAARLAGSSMSVVMTHERLRITTATQAKNIPPPGARLRLRGFAA